MPFNKMTNSTFLETSISTYIIYQYTLDKFVLPAYRVYWHLLTIRCFSIWITHQDHCLHCSVEDADQGTDPFQYLRYSIKLSDEMSIQAVIQWRCSEKMLPTTASCSEWQDYQPGIILDVAPGEDKKGFIVYWLSNLT